MTWHLYPASQLAEHAATWDRLQQEGANAPFLETTFVLPLLRGFGSGREVLAVHGKVREPDAVALVTPAGRGMWQTFQPSQLPVGAWISLAERDLGDLANGLTRKLPGLALGLGLTQLDPRFNPRIAQGPAIQAIDYIHTSYIELDGTFDAYWSARGKNLRQNTKKQRNKLAAEGVECQLECVRNPEEVPSALRQYGELESSGWKAGGGTAIHPDNAQGRFYTEMMQAFCAAGRGRIYRYLFGGRVVAMDLCVDNGPLVVILKTAYDEAYRNVSPSTLMRQEQFRAWWEEGRYQRIEFYGKTLEWHTRWTESGRTLYHMNVYRWPSVIGLVKRLRGRTLSQVREEPPLSAAKEFE